ncbi:hypothetical protein FBY35_6919 [Streptomyces sp. SLBN-118]|nr:hypothetical protein FBY35_6919 [Streptomyces sp. SLBN-118]
MGANVLEALREWSAASEARLRESGIACELVESPAEFDPSSVQLILETEEMLGEIIVWSNGKAEIQVAEVATGRVEREHREIVSWTSLDEALENLIARMTA